jgi:hypothetical protein
MTGIQMDHVHKTATIYIKYSELNSMYVSYSDVLVPISHNRSDSYILVCDRKVCDGFVLLKATVVTIL